jgi:hypothetical protein
MADRNRDKVPAPINWHAIEQLALQGGLVDKDDEGTKH